MTVSNLNFENSYTTDGVTSAYSFTFAATDPSQIQVFLNGVQQMSGFTTALSLVTVGGTVTFTSPPTTGQTLLLYRSSDLLQNDELFTNAQLPPATVEAMIDKLTIIAQQLQQQLNKAIVFPPTSGITFNANNMANWILGMDSTNAILEFLNPVTVFQNAFPSAGAGNVVNSTGSVTIGSLPTYSATNGQQIAGGIAPGTTNNVLTSNGTAWVSQAPGSGAPSNLVTTANPNGSNAGTAGQLCWDKINAVQYVCTTTGSSSTAVWTRITESIGTIKWWWSTSAPPTGYHVCDGTNGTPNMIGMFPQGSNLTGSSTDGNASGFDTAGSVANQSTVGAISNTTTFSGGATTSGPNSSIDSGTVGGNAAASSVHTHTISISGSTGSMDIQPSAIAAPWIMRIT